MKRICKWFALVIVVLSMLLALGGCGGSNDSDVVGTWARTIATVDAIGTIEHTFNKDGTGVVYGKEVRWETRTDGERKQLRHSVISEIVDGIQYDDNGDIKWGPWLDYRIEFGNEMVLDSSRYFRQ